MLCYHRCKGWHQDSEHSDDHLWPRWVDPNLIASCLLLGPLALSSPRPACEDTEKALPLSSLSPPPQPLPGPWAGFPALSGRVAAMGSDTLGKVLAVSEELLHAQFTWKGDSDGQGSASIPARLKLPSQSSQPLGWSGMGTPETPGQLLFTDPSWTNHAFLLPTVANGSSLAILPCPLPTLSQLFSCLLQVTFFPAWLALPIT